MTECYLVLEHFLVLDFFSGGEEKRLKFCGSCFLAAGSICICSPAPAPTLDVAGLCQLSPAAPSGTQLALQRGSFSSRSKSGMVCFGATVLTVFPLVASLSLCSQCFEHQPFL